MPVSDVGRDGVAFNLANLWASESSILEVSLLDGVLDIDVFR